MRHKFTTLLFALAASAGAWAQTTLFETGFATESDFAQWTVIDANGDEKTWAFAEDGTPSKVFYTYGAVQADDWLISPAITATESGTVKISYSAKGSSYYNEALEVYTGSSATVEGMTTKQADHNPVAGDVTAYFFLMKVEAGQTFHVGFRCTSPADLWRLYLCSVGVTTAEDAPDLKVKAITSPTTGNDLSDETVTVTVANDGTLDASDFPVAFMVDGEEKARETVASTLKAGEQMDYTFTAKADLSTPRHLYTVTAYTALASDIEPANDSTSVEVRHKAAATVPYTMGFEADEYTDDIKFYNLNEDSGDWSVFTDSWFYAFAHTGYKSLAYNYDSDNAANDWAILEPIKIEEAGTYVLRFWYSGDDNHPEKLAAYWGNGDTPDDMKNKIVEYAPFARGAYEESVSLVEIDSPQTIYIGFYAFSDKDENWICVDDISFYKATGDAVDIMATNLQRPFGYVRTPNASDAKFDLRNVGITDAEVRLTVNIDGEAKSTQTLSIAAQEYKTLTVAGVLDGLAEGSHTLAIVADCDNDTNAANDTIKATFQVLGSPVMLYDFEDGTLPSSIEYRVEDDGTVNPDAGSEFNEYGWGIIAVENYMYGNYILAGNTWIDGDDSADRWAIFPKATVGQGDAFFVWDASSGNQTLRENYQVRVSDGSKEPQDYWYTTECEVTMEDIYPTTRGISLAKYAGKDVYVAIRLTSEVCEFLALDNIGFYGDLTVAADGIATATAPKATATDQVYTLDGRKLSPKSPLRKGIYIRDGRKFVVK